jgi:hypothetical protein
VRAAADTMRANPGLDIATAITELAVGEALVSLLDAQGRPGITERVFVLPPGSRIGPITPEQRAALTSGSLVAGVYEQAVDRESAYEKLRVRATQSADTAAARSAPGTERKSNGATRPSPKAPPAAEAGSDRGVLDDLKDAIFGSTGPRGGRREGLAESAARSAVRSVGSAVGREIVRGVLGSLLGGGSRRR